MNKKHIGSLIDKFVNASIKHQSAIEAGNSRKANANAKKIHNVFLEIVELGNEARDCLLLETANENDDVALMAAVYSLKFCPEVSLKTLRKISKRTDMMGFRAQQAIQRWNEGSWQLE